jgi:hypothetical protein
LGLEQDSGKNPHEHDLGLKYKRRILERADPGSRVLEPLLKDKVALHLIPPVRGCDSPGNAGGIPR